MQLGRITVPVGCWPPGPITYEVEDLDEVEDLASFHNQFGWEFNDQVYRDAPGWTPT